MFEEISYMQIAGYPLIFHLGWIGLVLVIFTSMTPWLRKKGIADFKLAGHVWAARVAIVISLIHGLMGILARI